MYPPIVTAKSPYLDTSEYWTARFRTPDLYGAVGDGVTNDLNAINTALAALSAMGGGTLYLLPGKTYRCIGGNVSIPYNVTIEGASSVPIGYNNVNVADFIKNGSVIMIDPTRRVTMNAKTALRNVMIWRDGLSWQPANESAATAALAQWESEALYGAVQIIGQACHIENVSIVGFRLGLKVVQDGHRINGVYIDCIDGVEVTGNGETSRFANINCFPFWVGNLTSTTLNKRRSGTAFNIHDRADGATFTNCGCYGFQGGWRLSNVWCVSMVDCHYDNRPQSLTFGTVGVHTENCVSFCQFVNSKIGLAATNWKLNHTDAAHATAPPGAGLSTTCFVSIIGGYTGHGAEPGYTHFELGPYSRGLISAHSINAQGQLPFSVAASVSYWDVDGVMISDGVPAIVASGGGLASGNVRFTRIRNADTGATISV